jgi:hypothetical protein
LLLGLAAVAGAATWSLGLCTAVGWGARYATPTWDLCARGATGLLMLGFALRIAGRLLIGGS